MIYGYSFDYKSEGNAYFRKEHRYVICNNKNVVNNIDNNIFITFATIVLIQYDIFETRDGK